MSEYGVLYDRNDHLGFWKRTILTVIDLAVFVLLCIVAGVIVEVVLGKDQEAVDYTYLVVVAVLGYLYFVVLKRSTFRTVGYRIFGVCIVDLHGERPGVFKMISRLSFIAFGPLNGVIDLLWIPSDDARQAIRDKWSGTYVVRVGAEPIDRGPIVARRYGIMGFNIVFAEVARTRPQTP